MACIRHRQGTGGRQIFRVIWREGSTRDGKQIGEDFEDKRSAERFFDLVNGHGQQ